MGETVKTLHLTNISIFLSIKKVSSLQFVCIFISIEILTQNYVTESLNFFVREQIEKHLFCWNYFRLENDLIGLCSLLKMVED